MKLNNILYLAMILLLAACQEEVPPLGEPNNRLSALEGQWTLDKVVQTEISAEEKGFPDFVTSKDITTAISGSPFSDFQITFSGNQVTTILGNSPMAIAEGQGTWTPVTEAGAVVTDGLGIQAAHALRLEINGETYDLPLGSLAQLQDDTAPTLFLRQTTVNENGKPIIRYDYEFVKN